MAAKTLAAAGFLVSYTTLASAGPPFCIVARIFEHGLLASTRITALHAL